jgi:AcrR family transcriptional regulator
MGERVMEACSTRERILLTAERLFASQGIDQTSIRQINLAAGQRNSSATQYHFGSREDLITAILDYRREGINLRRLELLRELEATGRRHDPRGLAEALVLPVAELLTRDDAAGNYIVVTAQLIGHPQHYALVKNPGPSSEGLVRLYEYAREALPGVPPAVVLARIGMAIRHMFHELSDFQRVRLDGGRRPVTDLELETAGLVDAVAGMLAAPVSPGAARAAARPSRA